MERVTYDAEADALYVQLRDGSVARQVFIDDARILDYSEDGAIAGVEFVCASEGIDLSDVPFSRTVESLIGESGQAFTVSG